MRAAIDNVVAKLLISTYGHLRAESRRVGLRDPRRCFELLGESLDGRTTTTAARVARCAARSHPCSFFFLRLVVVHCLAGLDIELDSALRPWLLEVNVCPSLAVRGNNDDQIYLFTGH